jgi:hypothetical protein
MTGNSSAKLDTGYDSGSGFRQAVTRIIGDSQAASKGCELLKSDWIETPIGAMLAVANANALHLLKFFDGKALPNELKRLQEKTRSSIAFGRLRRSTASRKSFAIISLGGLRRSKRRSRATDLPLPARCGVR